MAYLKPILGYLFLSLILGPGSNSVAQTERTLRATDGTPVTIQRDSYGVPHITGESEIGVFFGQGFAVAEDRLAQLDLHRRAAEGRLSELFGIFSLSLDQETRMMYYTNEERKQQFEALPPELQDMVSAYAAGINTYVDTMAINPEKYRPVEFENREFQPWTVYNSIAVMQFLIRNFGQAGGEELTRLEELQENGQPWLDENRPINDENAPTTIRSDGVPQTRRWKYSGLRVRPEAIRRYGQRKKEVRAIADQLNIPQKFGSFAVLIAANKSGSGNVMLLGAPQMGEPVREAPSRTHEVELDCSAFHVGGMSIAGIPFVIIGRNEAHAWSMTSGVSDNSDVYIETTEDQSFSRYFHNGEWVDFEMIQDTIDVSGVAGVFVFTHYRTVHGPVFADDLANHQAFSMKMTFWNQELDMVRFALGIAKAKNLQEFEVAATLNPMSFNLFYAGMDQKVKFWHLGRYQDRSDGIDPRLPHSGDGTEEWGGFIPFEQLPQADYTEQDYFVNWNNKPASWWNNGDNIPWQGTTNLTNRVANIDAFVGPSNGFLYDDLLDVPRQISDHGTYQQALEFTPTDIIGANVAPPGQSGFIAMDGTRSAHYEDQWDLHLNWEFKDMIFDELVTSVEAEPEVLPKRFALHQNYPNPFNPTTTISYDLPESGQVRLEVFNINGQRVAQLVQAQQAAGRHKIEWQASSLSSGVYIYRLTSGGFKVVRKSLLLK